MFLSIYSLFFIVLLGLSGAFAAPVDEFDIDAAPLSPVARNILKRSIPAAPRYVVYSDAFISTTNPAPATSAIAGWTVFNIAFLTTYNADNYGYWVQMTAAERAAVKAEYAAAGIKLCVAAFGATEEPTNAGLDPVSLANSVAAAVIQYDLDGVDIDYEDFDSFNRKDGSAEAWLISFTTQLRKTLPVGQYIVTHAPVAPWFISELYNGKGYTYVDQQVGDLIDWYNVQFYNQGATEYTTCTGLLTQSSSTWPKSSVFEIAARGVPLDKIVIGKPAAANNANNGLMSTSLLASCAAQAVSMGWNAGIMAWQYPDASSAWIQAVRAGMGGASPGPTTTVSSTTVVTTTTSTSIPSPTSGSCANMAAWSSTVTYTAGVYVTYEGFLWKANQWNYNEVPGGSSGAWDKVFAC
ncbi:carbohydrate-binding module family 5 protein [Collybiopsis luxurians FD-317 M1]|uniref:Carbohydrate-binding module family 5 protein n=1 Tax=Collybiopsis luxurians FD-317 M1 TaxID=944289 RepID=A0A0D0D075_9AGAR|nr:carbohydrate-binding module family 5 protein [Collybiopsis luxurians FD-317 M1]